MPILYFAGFLCFLTSYWSDKILFLGHYKIPPLYTKRLVTNSIQIMEWGIVAHLVFGAFMITNKSIFDYKVTCEDELFKPFGQILGRTVANFMHIDSDRFVKPHGAIYIFIGGILIICFLCDKVTAWFLNSESGIISYSVVCCFSMIGVK